MTAPLLSVKFFIPRRNSILLKRSALVEKFSACLERPITLVSAPAGFGKTSLLALWIEHQRMNPEAEPVFDAIGWLSLDSLDNQPVRFWLYFISALQAGLSAPLREAVLAAPIQLPVLIELLQSNPPPDLHSVLNSLINQIDSFQQPLILVLDDYHVIQSPQIHEQMEYLVDHCPDNFHLVIASRADPPLPVARLRARRQVGEFRVADLRFSTQETVDFFKDLLCLELSRQEIQAIESSTEGWVAGLQMAGLALQAYLDQQAEPDEKTRQGKIHDFISTFSGKHIYILDFLADEVFNRQTEEVQTFLLKTSILERMNADLCNALIHSDDEQVDHSPPQSARQILEYLEKANLFIIPLDQDRTWYRYHHLFADLLRVRLDHLYPQLKRELHIRASLWFKENELEEEAIVHALAALDWDLAARLIEKNIQRFLEQGQLSKVLEWITRLPNDVSRSRAGLCLQQAWVMGIAQRQREFVSLLNDAEYLLQTPNADLPQDSENTKRLKDSLAILRAYQTVIEGNPQQAVKQIDALTNDLPTGNLWEDSWTDWIRGFAFRMMGQFDPAIEALRHALALSREQLWVDMVCCTDLGMIYHQQGKLQEAYAMFLQGLELRKFHTTANHGYLARLIASLCEVLLDLNRVDEAVRYGQMGLDWLKWWPSGNTWSQLYAVLGRIRLAIHDVAGAAEFILRADEDRRSWPLRPLNQSQVDDSLVRFWLATGDFQALEQWALEFGRNHPIPQTLQSIPDESLLIDFISYARIRLAQGRAGNAPALEEAERFLAALKSTTQSSGRIRYWIEISILHAVALQSKGTNGNRWDPEALRTLRQSLLVGESGGFIRPFVEGGPLIEKMLLAFRSPFEISPESGLPMQYLNSILAAFQSDPNQPGDRVSIQGLVEPISDREREVLRLLAAGFSNQEMAQKLIVSEGTIKSHLHHLFGKLDVRSRTQLIAKAKELKLI